MDSPARRVPSLTLGLTATLGGFALAGGAVTMVGWIANIRRLTDWENRGISQMPNNALAVMLSGAALILWSLGRRRWSTIFGAFAGLIGAATFFEHLSGIDLGIDQIGRAHV